MSDDFDTVREALAHNDYIEGCRCPACKHVMEALSRIEAENARLREALEPFAAEADEWQEMGDTRPIVGDSPLTVADLRRARAALNPELDKETAE